MNKVTLNLRHCYGIKSLTATLDFSKERVQAIYAPNGVMKSSFAQTLHDISLDVESKDRIFQDRTCVREVRDETGSDISSDSVFVVRPYDKDFAHTEKTSILLVDANLRKEYEQLQARITSTSSVRWKVDLLTTTTASWRRSRARGFHSVRLPA